MKSSTNVLWYIGYMAAMIVPVCVIIGHAIASEPIMGDVRFRTAPIVFAKDSLNPVLYNAGVAGFNSTSETSTLMDGTRMDVWFADSPDFTTLKYTYSDDNASHVYAQPVTCLTNIRFPYVIKSGSTYYLFAIKVVSGAFTDLYCWTSTDKTTWTIANGGNPVLTRGSGVWSVIFNVCVLEVNGVFHLWAEIASNQSQYDVGTAYSYSTISALNFDTNKTGIVIERAGNATLVHVPDRNAVIMLHGYSDPVSKKWDIVASTFYLSSDLASPASYRRSKSFLIHFDGMHTADADLVVTGRSDNLLLRYCHNQLNTYQLTADLTLNDLYDQIVYPKPVNTLEVSNAAASRAVALTAVGEDPNIPVRLHPKGNAPVIIDNGRLESDEPIVITSPKTITIETTGGSGVITIAVGIEGVARVSGGPFQVISSAQGGTKIALTKSNSGASNQNGHDMVFENLGPNNTQRSADVKAGRLSWKFSQPTNGSLQDGAFIEVGADGPQNGANTQSYISIGTAGTGGGSAVERVRFYGDGRMALRNALSGSRQSLTGSGAVDLKTLVTAIASTGTDTLTLADGEAEQLKVITMVTDGGDATLTPTTKTGYTSITFNDVTDCVFLRFDSALGWTIISNHGAVVNP